MENQTQIETLQKIKMLKESLIKRLAESHDETYEILLCREYQASLYRGEKLLSNGIAEVSKDHVRFCPDVPKQLDGALHNGATLKVSSGKTIPLLQSLESFYISNDRYWFFELGLLKE